MSSFLGQRRTDFVMAPASHLLISRLVCDTSPVPVSFNVSIRVVLAAAQAFKNNKRAFLEIKRQYWDFLKHTYWSHMCVYPCVANEVFWNLPCLVVCISSMSSLAGTWRNGIKQFDFLKLPSMIGISAVDCSCFCGCSECEKYFKFSFSEEKYVLHWQCCAPRNLREFQVIFLDDVHQGKR